MNTHGVSQFLVRGGGRPGPSEVVVSIRTRTVHFLTGGGREHASPAARSVVDGVQGESLSLRRAGSASSWIQVEESCTA